jgi:FkbM family methyltransferase
MIKTATNIVKGVFQLKKRNKGRFSKIGWAQEKILKHQEDKNIKCINFKQFSIWYKRPYELLHTYKDIFENEIYKFHTQTSEPIIIDCGSNIGLSVIYYKQLYPNASILAFEPDKQNFQLLKKNVVSNNYQNVHLNEAAVWITDGEIFFDANETEASHISESDHATKVKAIRLKNVLNNYYKIDFLKVDIEGAEWQVITDCEEELIKVNNLFLEYHGRVHETNKLNNLLEIVYKNGFNVYIKNAADNISHPFVEKTTNTIYDVQLNIFCFK